MSAGKLGTGPRRARPHIVETPAAEEETPSPDAIVAPPAEPAAEPRSQTRPAKRTNPYAGLKPVSGYISQEMWLSLMEIRVMTGKSLVQMIEEGLQHVIDKHEENLAYRKDQR